MRYLVTGGCGFIGSNLAGEILRRDEELFVLDNLYRYGAGENLAWLKTQGAFEFVHADVRSRNDVEGAVRRSRPDVVFHLAGQVAMTTSVADPRLDFETNVLGGHNVLEAVRNLAPNAILIYSSTNKVYGDLESIDYREDPTRYTAIGHEHGFDEAMPLDFRSPYGCSKGAMDQYALDYGRIFGMQTVVFRHSSVFGSHQYATYDQGWIGWFIQKAIETKKGASAAHFTISGNGKQVRDVLFVDDLVTCYFAAIGHIEAARGQAFNLGGGPQNSLSLLELFHYLENRLDVKLDYERLPWRQSDQKVFVADIRKVNRLCGWQPGVEKDQGLERMLAWVSTHV